MTDKPVPAADEVISRVTGLPTNSGFLLVLRSRERQHKFLPTLLSWWQSEGRTVGPGLEHELRLHRERIDRYGVLWAQLVRDYPGIYQARGDRIRSLYPDPLVRQQEDLDLTAPSEEFVWSICSDLISGGWSTTGLWLVAKNGSIEYKVVLERPTPEPLSLRPDRVEVSTITMEGDFWHLFPRGLRTVGYQPVTLATVALVDELATRDRGARDAYDLLILSAHLTDAGLLRELGDAVAAHGLVPEWRTVCHWWERTGVCDLATLPDLQLDVPNVVAAGRRLTHRSRALRDPFKFAVLALAHSIRRGQSARRPRASARSRQALTMLQERLGARRLIDRGVPMFAALLERPRPGGDLTHATLFVSGPYAELTAPIGSFVLSAGGDIPERWLDRRRLVSGA